MRRIPRLLLDMDDVLADFIGGVCDLYGVTYRQAVAEWTPGAWGLWRPVALAAGRPELTEGDFWASLDRKEGFWAGLEPLPWFKEMVRLADEEADEWIILSAGTWCPSSRAGKEAWCRRHLGWDRREVHERLCTFPQKHMFATRGTVLVDDKESAVVKFIIEGGNGIVFPRHHNGLHRHQADPLGHVCEILGREPGAVH